MMPIVRLVLIGLLVIGCTERGTEDAGPTADAGVEPNPDAAVIEEDAAVDAGLEPNLCDELGLARAPFQPGAASFAYGDLAGDFSLTELDGTTFTLSEQWTGCESYVFITYIPTSSPEPKYEDRMWASSPLPLIENAPRNTHFFFLALGGNPDRRLGLIEDMKARVDALLDGEEDPRFHYVVEHPMESEGAVGAFLRDFFEYQADRESWADLGDRGMAPPPLPFVFAIDRDQRWDAGGTLDEVVGGGPSMQLASWLPAFFDHKARIRDAEARESGVETILLLDEQVTERVFEREVTLPPASELAELDTMELDVTVECRERNVFNCSEWDRIARIELCMNADCSQRAELVRWITPYWRVGSRRWVMDASALLGLVADGGAKKFRIEMGPTWERATTRRARVALKLSNRGAGVRATGAEPAFGGGRFDDTYNDRAPLSFTPPASATKVELLITLSGHGQESTNNCAEWCDHRHQFTVNGVDLQLIRHDGTIGSRAGCAPYAAQGVPPGQFGNWAPERAYWCPGLPVAPIRIDITEHVTPGQANQLEYTGNYRGGTPAGGDIALSSYVVWYE